ncbi:MAG: hypothetical protein M0D53_00335 [Flavobacterium sp. JAD_PAG50586_2]|nr:MAG: hypothetical protein M0D53_00335 [Flavobacterium sp. JAD_PAG50586_2]
MKTNSPNVLFNHQANLLLGKTSQVMKQKLLLILMLVSLCTGAIAQGNRTSASGTIVVTDMNSILSSNGTSSARLSNTNTVNVSRVRDLVTQVQSASYFYEGEVKTYGDAPVNLYTDLSSLNQVNNSVTLKQNIEIVTVRIRTASELNSTIDLAAFSNFPSLKYIYFISGSNTTSDTIARRLVNYDERFSIFYKVDKGDSNQ